MIKYLKVILSALFIYFSCINHVHSQQRFDYSNIVDYHVHIFSPELLENLEQQGYSFKRSGFKVIKERQDYSNLSEISTDNGQSKMLLISVGYAYKNLNGTLPEREFVKKENDLLSTMVNADRERLLGFYGIDPLKDFAIEEIKRCDEKLKLDGIKLHLQANNLDLKDTTQLNKLKEVIQLADERNIPLLIHNNARDNTFGKEYFSIFKKEILDKCEPLTIIFAHCGSGGGMDEFCFNFLNAFRAYVEDHSKNKKHKIYLDLSAVIKPIAYPGERPKAEFLKLMHEIGLEKFVFGSDYPVRSSPGYLREVSQLLSIDDEVLASIAQRNLFESMRRDKR